MAISDAVIEFLGGWRQELRGAIERGGRLTIDYDKSRLGRCFTNWRGAEFGDLVAHVRFHPRGDIVSGSVAAPVKDDENPSGMIVGHTSVPLDVQVPSDATQAEIWFQNFSQTSSRCDAWDSQFGANYWFDVGGAQVRIPPNPVSYRRGAVTRPDVVSVLSQSASKVNAFPRQADGETGGVNLQTKLEVVSWVNETKAGANAWVDVHVFDSNDALVYAVTQPLLYTGFSAASYEFLGTIYQGSTATPGSAQPSPDARKVQYRLYYEINYQVFTDGILHQHDLEEDAVVSRGSQGEPLTPPASRLALA
jgi:hypothetical protein